MVVTANLAKGDGYGPRQRRFFGAGSHGLDNIWCRSGLAFCHASNFVRCYGRNRLGVVLPYNAVTVSVIGSSFPIEAIE